MLSRKKARDSVYKLIYEYLFLNKINEKSLAIATAPEMSKSDLEYIHAAYYGVVEKKDELLAQISEFTNKFPINRIFKLDLAALLLATYEMLYMDDIPMSVSISEAVELVKEYSTEKSNQYVNGILSSIYKKLNGEEKEEESGERVEENGERREES
jgi:transcription antitermination factor NusB